MHVSMFLVDWLSRSHSTLVKMIGVIIAKFTDSFQSLDAEVAAFDTLDTTEIRKKMFNFGQMWYNG
jgi:hypothetical protein